MHFVLYTEAKEFLKTMTKGGGRGGAAQLISSAATGTAKQCAKEIGKRATGEGVKKAAAQLTIAGAKVVAKQAALQAVKPKVVVIGMVIEGGMLIHEIRTAHNRRRRGEITKEQFHDTVVEQTATTGGSTAGGIGGSLVGASVGAVVGSVVPVVGTVIGGTIGTVVGGFAGGLGGSLAGKGVGKLINAVRRS